MQAELLLHGLGIKDVNPWGPEKMNLLEPAQHCTLESCQNAATIFLESRPYCLEHFIGHCYELLDRLDPRIRGNHAESAELHRLREAVEECSNRALLLSLRCETLTNSDRSRLLDILLWSSDLLFLLNISPHDFALLKAFRTESERTAGFETSPRRPVKTQSHGKTAENS